MFIGFEMNIEMNIEMILIFYLLVYDYCNFSSIACYRKNCFQCQPNFNTVSTYI